MKNKNIRFINILFFTVTLFLLLASCSMAGTQKESSVSFKLDSQTVQNIRASVAETNSVSKARAADDDKLFIEVLVQGEYETAVTEPLVEDQIITVKGIPKGVEIYVEAIAYSTVNHKRINLYKGHSKSFVVANKENNVMFVMKKVSGGVEGGNSGSGSGSSSSQTPDYNYVIYVADSANNGFFLNDGTEARPLDTIDNAIAKIVSLVKAHKADATKSWTITLLSNIEGSQVVDPSFDGYAAGLTITSKDSGSVRTIGNASSFVGLAIFTDVPVTIKDLNVTSGKFGVGIGDFTGSGQVYTSTLIMENGSVGGTEVGVYIGAHSTFKMRGGTVTCYNDTEPSWDAGVYIEDGSCNFSLSGNSVINTYIQWDDEYKPICIDGPLTGTTPVVTFYTDGVTSGEQVLTTSNGVELSDVIPKFGIYGSFQFNEFGQVVGV